MISGEHALTIVRLRLYFFRLNHPRLEHPIQRWFPQICCGNSCLEKEISLATRVVGSAASAALADFDWTVDLTNRFLPSWPSHTIVPACLALVCAGQLAPCPYWDVLTDFYPSISRLITAMVSCIGNSVQRRWRDCCASSGLFLSYTSAWPFAGHGRLYAICINMSESVTPIL